MSGGRSVPAVERRLARPMRNAYTPNMKAFLLYLREHPWQRRVLTAALAVVAGMLAAVLAYPVVRDHLLLRRLASEDHREQSVAVAQATVLAAQNPRTLRRLERALRTEDDRKFLAVAEVLWNLGRFHTPDRDPTSIDRWRALQLASPLAAEYTPDALAGRLSLLMRTITDGRDNRYVRGALSSAAGSHAPELRRLSATLAARLEDCDTLERLLKDDSEDVAAQAALAAGVGGCASVADTLTDVFGESDSVEVVSAAAYALAIIDAESWSELITHRMRNTETAELRDRLLLLSPVLDTAEPAVEEILEQARRQEDFPPAAALLAAARMGIEVASQSARDVLAAAAEGSDKLNEPQVLAAIDTARVLDVPVVRDLDAYCRGFWSHRLSASMGAAARLLAEQADVDEEPEVVERAIDTLRRAAVYPPPDPQSGEPKSPGTPGASAEAAVGLWILGCEDAEQYVRRISRRGNAIAVDVVAWRLSRADTEAAFELGLRMLPVPGVPPEQRVYNDNERATGAMLLALSARTPQQRQDALQRMRRRLDRVAEPFIVRTSLHCGLVILGEQDSRPMLREVLSGEVFPPRRALTALLASGDRAALDWLLWNPDLTDAELLELLIDEGFAEVLAEAVPELPRVDMGVGPDLRFWQLRICRQYYLVHRERLQAELER